MHAYICVPACVCVFVIPPLATLAKEHWKDKDQHCPYYHHDMLVCQDGGILGQLRHNALIRIHGQRPATSRLLSADYLF